MLGIFISILKLIRRYLGNGRRDVAIVKSTRVVYYSLFTTASRRTRRSTLSLSSRFKTSLFVRGSLRMRVTRVDDDETHEVRK